ncbi:tetratricopeptide-like helical domain-containing protein [Artemisia annua]|uniref:Tetratricopeptide-like helical domain-containing protein n=1 Tax=Artemisia annua TaxID=35608 RepID=A0A2U1P117_ARTAN|nr:tetratricopeptide-like helical domain-containing protein [Artemisia annua]
MVGTVRCYSFQPNSTSHLSGKLASLLVNVRDFVSLRNNFRVSLKTYGASLHAIYSMRKKPSSCGSFVTREIGQTCNGVANESTTLHQKFKIPRSLPVELVVTNVLLLATPLDAMAETCETEQSLFSMNMPLLLLVALIGATVGGLLARQRKGELQRLNEQLRQINTALKRQAKIESYAPTLTYAPVGSKIADKQVIVDPRKQDLLSRLKNGKNFLRNQDPEKAFFEFQTALELAQAIKDPIEEKKAARGLGASLQRQGKHNEAVKYHSMVLSISEREGEDSGNTEAYGAIADCYTELGDLERAATFYDQYISRLQVD